MAIVEMRKLQLIAMSYEKDAILNALQRTNAVEVVVHANEDNTIVPDIDDQADRSYFASVETALESLCLSIDRIQKERGEKSDLLKDGFDVSYTDFMSMQHKKEDMDLLVKTVNELSDEKNLLIAERGKLNRSISQAKIYSCLERPFSYFSDTLHTKIKLGTVTAQTKENVCERLSMQTLCTVETLNENGEEALLLILTHKEENAVVDGILSEFSFSICPYAGEQTGAQLYADLLQKQTLLDEKISQNEATMYALKDKVRDLKVYCDYLDFTLEKEETNEKLRETERTFLLQAYLPITEEENVKTELQNSVRTVYMEFSDPTEEDEPPTLLQNNGIVSNFESITNTYSTPNYREFDPNAVMSFFYSLFMGFIIGDAGYGLLMALVGGWLWLKNKSRPTGMSRLAGAFAVGGLFAIMWGALFNSFFGMMLLPFTVMPNPQTDMWMLAGISVPSVLIISMELGIFQILIGYICKAVQEWRRGNVMDGICDGIIWAIFSVGMALLIVGFVEEAGIPILGTIGAIIAGGSLVLAMITAGRKEKFLKKFTKGFGAVYGIINYASDILSYARLYGLMLSGAVIAQIIATYSGQFLVSGNVALMVLGIVILLVGHGFNLVMNLLGAYIHDARLQYVEFYGRFFEGDGEPFRPLGSEHKHVYLLPAEKKGS